MKRFFLVLASVMALALMATMMVAWWFLDADDVKPPELPGTLQFGSLEHQGLTRSWRAYIPSSGAASAPVLLLLHGSRGDGGQFLASSFYSFDVEAQRQGFIAVYPDGFDRHWNDCRGSADYAANTRNIDDVGFLRRLVEQLALEHGADSTRVYVVGLSNGGQMAFRMGFEAPDLVTGIGAIGANLPVAGNLDCERSGLPVATLIVNGTEDPVNPYAGGLVEVFGNSSRGAVESAADSAHYWANLADYAGEGAYRVWPELAPEDDTRVESTLWSGPGQPPVLLITVLGGGHTLPHPVFRTSRILGRTSHEFDTARVVWAFFNGEPYMPSGR